MRARETGEMTIKTKTSQSKLTRRLVRGLRENLGIPVADLAHRANVPMAKLHAWEQGKRKLTLNELGRAVHTLGEIMSERDDTTARLEAASVESGGLFAKEYRQMHGITQFEVAREMGITQTAISLYEKGFLKFTDKELGRLSAAMNRLREKHALTANELKLFRDIEASLRRELAEQSAAPEEHSEEAPEGKMMKLSSLVGGKVTEEWAKGLRRKDGDD